MGEWNEMKKTEKEGEESVDKMMSLSLSLLVYLKKMAYDNDYSILQGHALFWTTIYYSQTGTCENIVLKLKINNGRYA